MIRNGGCLLYAFCFIAALAASPGTLYPAQANVQTDSLHHRIMQLYEEGSFLAAEIEGRRLIEEGSLSDSVMIQIEKYIAFSLIAQDKPQSAVSHFRTILQIDSSFELDPQLTSPKILSVFQQTRDKFFAERPLIPQPIPRRELPAPASAQISWRAVVFPGWEQLYRGRDNTGYAFLAAGAASLLSTVYCDIQRRHFKDAYMDATLASSVTEEYKTYDNYHKAEIISAVIFGLTYVLSEIDIFTNIADDTMTFQSTDSQNSYTIVSMKIHF